MAMVMEVQAMGMATVRQSVVIPDTETAMVLVTAMAWAMTRVRVMVLAMAWGGVLVPFVEARVMVWC